MVEDIFIDERASKDGSASSVEVSNTPNRTLPYVLLFRNTLMPLHMLPAP